MSEHSAAANPSTANLRGVSRPVRTRVRARGAKGATAVNTAQKQQETTAVNTVQKPLATPAAPPVNTGGLQGTAPRYSDQQDQRAADYLSAPVPSSKPEAKVKVLKIENDGSPPSLQLARSFLAPTAINTIVAETFIDNSNLDLSDALKVVREGAEKVVNGDMSGLETTLVANVTALNAIFGTMAVYAQGYLKAGKLPQFEMLMRVAFKAQSQLRTSIDSLAELKNPKPIFAKNLNVANGNQQVNSTTGPQQIVNGPVRAENEALVSTNKLLETT